MLLLPTEKLSINKWIHKWIQLGIIEPSKNYWKLNEIAISDEFPLPKQEDILQALKGSQWLSTLEALAGFTQVEVEPKEREKLAF